MYKDYSTYLREFFGATKVQKISVNTGRSCPNRDGTIGTGGCIYCNNASFTPRYCFGIKGVKAQIEAGKQFFSRKYPEMKYIAYFQSYTSTHNVGLTQLRAEYEEALGTEGVVGLAIGTRPDCVSSELIEMLSELNKEGPVFVELGVETLHDRTLATIRRGHDSATSRSAIRRLADAGLHVGVHIISGLPGEDDDDFLFTVRELCALPVESLKLHHLQVLRGTPLSRLLSSGGLSVKEYGVEEYMRLCMRAVEVVPPEICIERFLASAPPEMVERPAWGLKNYEFTNRLKRALAARTPKSPDTDKEK